MPKPRLLTLADRSLVNGYLAAFPPLVSEMTFTNLYLWRRSRPVCITDIADTLIFSVPSPEGDSHLVLGEPAGPLPLAEVLRRFSSRFAGAIRVPLDTAGEASEPGQAVTPDRDNDDYVYRVADLAGLSGRRYAKKRNKIKQCLANYECRYEPVGPSIIAECREMQEEWCRSRNCGRQAGLCHENLAVLEMFDYFTRFELLGGAVRVNGRLRAFAVGEELHPGTAVCHFEKAMPEIPGLGQLINKWFAENTLAGFTFVNREQDLGIPGLRQAKKSYYPHHMVRKCMVGPPGLLRLPSPKADGCAHFD